MRSLCVLVALVFIPALFAEAAEDKAKVIGPAEAIKLAKERQVVVELQIKSVGLSKEKEHWWLNSEADYKDAKNFTVFIPKSTVDAFKKINVTDPEKEYKGKTIQVTGYLSVHKSTTQVTLNEVEHLKIVKK